MRYAIEIKVVRDRLHFEAFIIRKSDGKRISCGRSATYEDAERLATYWAKIG